MADITVPTNATLTLRLKFDSNARYSVDLYKQELGGPWSNAPLQDDALVFGKGGADFTFGPVPARSRWVIVVSANMTTTAPTGAVSCDVKVLLGNDVMAAQTASGTIASDDQYLPRRVRMDFVTN